jgi:hypothetical protein
MLITREWVDTVCPEHDRTSCSDDNVANGFYSIVEEKLKGVIIRRKFDPFPRCYRCFLLNHVGGEIDPRVEVKVCVHIEPTQPEFHIIEKKEKSNV